VACQRVATGVAQFGHTGLDIERGTYRPQRIVAMGNRRAEERHDGIADMLVHAAAILRDDGVGARVERVHQPPEIFGVELRG
jgi:hypothetical protein